MAQGSTSDFPRSTHIILAHRSAMDLGALNNTSSPDNLQDILVGFLQACNAGIKRSDAICVIPNVLAAATRAAAVWAISGGAGTVGMVLNGISLTAVFATSDQNTAGLVAAAVAASVDPNVQNIFEVGTTQKATIALASFPAASWIEVFGTRFTAVQGATGNVGDFDISGNDTADAAALAAAMNAYPIFNENFYAYSSAANVFVYKRKAAIALTKSVMSGQSTAIGSNSTTATITQFTNDPSFCISALEPGVLGNGVTIAASGTGASLANNGTRSGDAVKVLTAGAGGNGAQRFYYRT